MHTKLPETARPAVAVSVAALITAAALFGSLAPEVTGPPLPLPTAGVDPPVTAGITGEGPLAGRLTRR
ncbi:hypothetical protein ACWDTR_03830 [Streptomyces sp. NPDC003470]|uniref:hypothetical protein n=1 Tax=unclassified Streptomyces TaxID=2593676 RepID=UPI00366156F7